MIEWFTYNKILSEVEKRVEITWIEMSVENYVLREKWQDIKRKK